MEKIYVIAQFEEGDIITQDGFLLTTQGSFATIDLITQSGDVLGGRVYDDLDVFNLGYKTLTNVDRFVNYVDNNKINQVSVSSKLYNPSITEKIYGN